MVLLLGWGAFCLHSGVVRGQPLPAANPISSLEPSTSFSLQLENVIRLPDSGTQNNQFARIEQLSPATDGSDRLFVLDSRGKLYHFQVGDTTPTEFFDFAASIPNFRETRTSGVRSFAFHPDAFRPGADGQGKLYVAFDIETDTPGVESHRSVVSEWTFDANENVQPSSRRDLIVQSQPLRGHNVGKLGFNPNLELGDPDYGNLYITFGDGGNHLFEPDNPNQDPAQQFINTRAQDTTNFLGSVLRIDPLQNGQETYRVPTDNPFVGQSGFRPEIWAYGLRNPHQFGWDRGGAGDLLIADIGQSNIEEVNLGVAGANYGWSQREGTFDVAGKEAIRLISAEPLPADHPGDPFTYPVLQYDHDPDNTGKVLGSKAIAGGFVYRGSRVPELRGKYVFGNFAGDSEGPIYVVDADRLTPRDDFSDLDSLSGGFLAPIEKLRLNDTQGQEISFIELVRAASGINTNRTDLRFGYGPDGEVYVTSKRDGWVRRFVETLGEGDYNLDAAVDARDYTVWRDSVGQSGVGLPADGDDNDLVDLIDYALWRENFTAPDATARTLVFSVPEPATAALVVAAALLAPIRRRADTRL